MTGSIVQQPWHVTALHLWLSIRKQGCNSLVDGIRIPSRAARQQAADHQVFKVNIQVVLITLDRQRGDHDAIGEPHQIGLWSGLDPIECPQPQTMVDWSMPVE